MKVFVNKENYDEFIVSEQSDVGIPVVVCLMPYRVDLFVFKYFCCFNNNINKFCLGIKKEPEIKSDKFDLLSCVENLIDDNIGPHKTVKFEAVKSFYYNGKLFLIYKVYVGDLIQIITRNKELNGGEFVEKPMLKLNCCQLSDLDQEIIKLL